jgi:hypothetical protein
MGISIDKVAESLAMKGMESIAVGAALNENCAGPLQCPVRTPV